MGNRHEQQQARRARKENRRCNGGPRTPGAPKVLKAGTPKALKR